MQTFVGYREQYCPKDTYRSLEDVQDRHQQDFAMCAAYLLNTLGVCRVLDLGCGNSTFLVDLKQNVPNVDILGIDVCPKEFRNTPQHPEVALQPEVTTSANDLGMLQDETFELVVSTWGPSYYGSQGVFHTYKKTFISETVRVLSRGGLAFFVPEHTDIDDYFLAAPDKIEKLRANNPFSWRKTIDYIAAYQAGHDVIYDKNQKTVQIRKSK